MPHAEALTELIAYIRRCYLPHSPTVALLRAYDALAAENAALRDALALVNIEPSTAPPAGLDEEKEAWREEKIVE